MTLLRDGYQLLSDVKDGLVRIAVAITGKYEKDEKPFAITSDDLKTMAENLKNREIPIDYEHLSANPNAKAGETKAAGWIKTPDKIERMGDGREILWAWAEFTPSSLTAIRNREFKYLSPEVHWHEKDENGKPIGTRAAACALTNRPFLKDLPPIVIKAKDYPALLEAVALSELQRERLVDVGQVHVPADINTSNKKGKPMKKLALKKVPRGDDKGKQGIFDGEELIGLVDADELEELAGDVLSDQMGELEEFKKFGDAAELRKKLAKYDETMGELEELRKFKAGKKLAADEMEELEELRKFKKAAEVDLAELKKLRQAVSDDAGEEEEEEEVDDGSNQMKKMKKMKKLSEIVNNYRRQAAETVCLSEFAKQKTSDDCLLLAEDMTMKGTLSPATFIRQQRISALVDKSIKAGKIVPAQREAVYKLAIADYKAVEQFLTEARPVLDLKTHGIEGTDSAHGMANKELDEAIKVYMTEHKDAKRVDALREVTRQNPRLWERCKAESQILIETEDVAVER